MCRELNLATREQMQRYRVVAAGLKSKEMMLYSLSKKKYKDQQSVDSLVAETSEMERMYLTLKFWYGHILLFPACLD